MTYSPVDYSLHTAIEVARAKPGYVPRLHRRRPGEPTCKACDLPWPCPGAREQVIEARLSAREWWYLPWDPKTGESLKDSRSTQPREQTGDQPTQVP